MQTALTCLKYRWKNLHILCFTVTPGLLLIFCCILQDEFSAVITKALITLVHGIETKFDAEMAAMTRVPWGTLESVGDQSE